MKRTFNRYLSVWMRNAMVGAAVFCVGVSCATAAGTLDKVRDTKKLVIGYVADGSPLSHIDAAGKVAGYAIALCTKVADAARTELKLPSLDTEFVAVKLDERFQALAQGRIDLLCGTVPTLSRRTEVDFSIPIGFVGVNAVVRSDAPVRLVQVLSGREPPDPVVWRGASAPERRTIAVVAGTTVQAALAERLAERRIFIDVMPVKDTAAGLQAVLDRKAAAFLDGRVLLVDAIAKSPDKTSLAILDKVFRREQVALGVRLGDNDFRLLADRTLSRIYRSPELANIYRTHLQPPDRATLDFFELVALPE